MMNSKTKLENVFCANGLLERPRYFPRQLITPAEMTLEQNYFRDKMRRHNRLLHGWGVVCGAQVCLAPKPGNGDFEPWQVLVHPGYILGPYGDEILIDQERVVDLRTEGLVSLCGEPAGTASDPWCSNVFVRREQNEQSDFYVAVKYKEVLTRPVRVQPGGCSCGDAHCEYSRLCDGYEIGILNQLPASHQTPMPELSFEAFFSTNLQDCPACPTEPWVVLAKVTLRPDGVVELIDNCAFRRIVASFSQIWGKCSIPQPSITTTEISLPAGKGPVPITVAGTNFQPKATGNLGDGITFDPTSTVAAPDGKAITFQITVDDTVKSGNRDLRIINPDCSMAIKEVKIVIPEDKTAASRDLKTETPKAKPVIKPARRPRP